MLKNDLAFDYNERTFFFEYTVSAIAELFVMSEEEVILFY